MTHDHHDTSPEEPQRLPKLVRLYVVQVAIGFALSAVFVGLMLGLNVANLRGLIFATQGGYIAMFLLFFFNGLLFAGVQFAITIMRMAAPEDHGPHGGRGIMANRAPMLTPIPVEIDRPR